jgi:hypothetical protein
MFVLGWAADFASTQRMAGFLARCTSRLICCGTRILPVPGQDSSSHWAKQPIKFAVVLLG